MNLLKPLCWILIATVFSLSCMGRQHPAEVVAVYTSEASAAPDDRLASLADFVAWKLSSKTIREIALYQTESYEINEQGFQGRVEGYSVWVSFFDVLGIRPLLGRSFLPEEKQPDRSNVVILCYDFWQRAFNGDPAIIGRTISVGDGQRTVVGVMPKSMDGLGSAQVLTPFVPGRIAGDTHDREYYVIAALRPGVTLMQAQAELDVIDRKRHREDPKYASSLKAVVTPFERL
jgi:hypothetical protein